MCQFLKDEIILHRNVFCAKSSNIGLPRENAHHIINDQYECMRVKKTKKGKFRDKIEYATRDPPLKWVVLPHGFKSEAYFT